MERSVKEEQGTIRLKVSELLKKFKHKEDRYNFCRQKGYWLPKEVGFDSTFFVKFLCKQKKLIPIGRHSDFKLSYFRGDGLLTKQFLLQTVKSKNEYESYLPDGIKLESLSKDFLFSLIAHVDPQTYSGMYDLYKKKLAQNIYKKWDEYTININQEIVKSIEEYVPSKNNIKNLKPFRLSKNHSDTGIFIHDEVNIQNNPNNNGFEANNININPPNDENRIRIEPMMINHENENDDNELGNYESLNNMDL